METIGIETSAMLVELNVSCWTARKLDRQVSEEIDAAKNTKVRGGNYHKDLLAGSKSLEDVKKYAARVRLWNTDKYTLPWSDKGPRLIPMANFVDYKKELTEHEVQFNNLCQKFFAEYPTLISASAFSLGDMFNRDEYPELDQIKSKFRFVYTFTPVPAVCDFRCQINEQAKAELIQQYEAAMKERVEGAMRDVWERLHKCLTHMSDRLANDEEGNRKGFHTTLLGNAKELVDLLSNLNITNDPKLEQAKRDLSSALLLVDTDMLKESNEIRLQTKSKVDDILSKFTW